MFQIYYRYLQLKYKINKVLTIITDFGITLFVCFILVLFYSSIGLFDF